MWSKETLRKELACSQRIVRDGHEVVPRILAWADDGQWLVFMPLPDEPQKRKDAMELLKSWLALKMALELVMASELAEPDAICCVGLRRAGDNVQGGCVLQRITRKRVARKIKFGPEEWLGPESVGDEVMSLLPQKSDSLSKTQIAAVNAAFASGVMQIKKVDDV